MKVKFSFTTYYRYGSSVHLEEGENLAYQNTVYSQIIIMNNDGSSSN